MFKHVKKPPRPPRRSISGCISCIPHFWVPIFGHPGHPNSRPLHRHLSKKWPPQRAAAAWLQTPWKNDEKTRFSENKWRKHDKQYDKTLVVCENPKFPKHENSSAKSAKKTCRMFVFSGQQYLLESD